MIGNIENQFQRIQKNTNYRLQVNRKDISEAKLRKAKLQGIVEKLNLLINLKAMHGVMYIKVVLKLIQLNKIKFISEIEEGLEVYIPSKLSMRTLPASYRYYDPIIIIIQEKMTIKIKQKAFIKEHVAHSVYKTNDILTNVMINAGIKDKPTTQRIVQHHIPLNDFEKDKAGLMTSPYTGDLQRSNHIMIDSTLTKSRLLNKHYSAKFYKKPNLLDLDYDPFILGIKYCPDSEVSQKYHQSIVMKSAFCVKMNNLKRKGLMFQTLQRFNEWLTENLEELYKDPVLRKIFSKKQ